MEFFQTKMGHKFFNKDFPRLVRALEKIADMLEKKTKISDDSNNESHRSQD